MLDPGLGLKAGDVFTWVNYPLEMNEQKERRWFIFLGNYAIEEIVFEVTTTTQLLYYKPDGKRNKNNFFKIQAGIGGLIQDSIVDLTMYYEDIPESLINDNKVDIQKQGTLPQATINTLVKKIIVAGNIPGNVKKNIYRYLREAGFTVNVK